MRRTALRAGLLLLLVGAAWTSLGAGVAEGMSAGACTITQTHSISGTVKTAIQFVNKTTGTVKVYWLDYTGKRVYYFTLGAGKTANQGTFDTHAWVVLDASGRCIGYVVAPKAQYVITGTASSGGGGGGSPAPAPARAPAMPHWVYQMINDFNLGISQPSGTLKASLTLHHECALNPPNWSFVDANGASLTTQITSNFAPYSKLIPGWVKQIGGLKQTAATKQALADLKAAEPLHTQEVEAWSSAAAALKGHNCSAFLSALGAAAKVGAPDWADQYTAVNDIARIYGSNAASHQYPYAQKLG